MYRFELVKTLTVFEKTSANLLQLNQSCQFKLKFGTKSNLNMKNSMVMCAFSVFTLKIPFLANLVQKN